MAEPRRSLSQPEKVCCGNIERFDMLECKSMAIPMDTNLKLLADESPELVDVTQYRHIIGLLMYMTNTRQIYALL